MNNPKYRFTLDEPPSANRWWRMVVQNPGTTKARAVMVTSKDARDYKEKIGLTAGALPKLKGPVSITLDWFRSRKSGDLDKRIGVALDALQGVFYDNDSQIVELLARRHDDDAKNPRLDVSVGESTGFGDPRPGMIWNALTFAIGQQREKESAQEFEEKFKHGYASQKLESVRQLVEELYPELKPTEPGFRTW